MADFRKLGLDRMSTGIAKSVGGGTTTLVTGDITRGELVEVEIEGGGGEATVNGRRTAALIAGVSLTVTTDTPTWEIVETTLIVSGVATGATGSIIFWVF